MSKLEEKDWCKLCELVAKETDLHKLPKLLRQLTEALDARAKRFNVHSNAFTPNSPAPLGARVLRMIRTA
jgi:hypothetical protein